MLLREKYDVLINVTWDCFDQSNFCISRINIIEWNRIIYLPITGPERTYKNQIQEKEIILEVDTRLSLKAYRLSKDFIWQNSPKRWPAGIKHSFPLHKGDMKHFSPSK
jgi:hypothetical protein